MWGCCLVGSVRVGLDRSAFASTHRAPFDARLLFDFGHCTCAMGLWHMWCVKRELRQSTSSLEVMASSASRRWETRMMGRVAVGTLLRWSTNRTVAVC